MIIRLKKPYQIIPHLKKFTIPEPTPCLFENNTFWRIYQIDGEFVPVSVEIFSDKLEVKYFGDIEKEKVRKLIKYVFAVDFDWKKFERKMKRFLEIYHLIQKYRGLRPMRTTDIYEALVKGILQQRINLKIALYTTSKLVKKYGKKIEKDKTYYSFIIPSKIKDVKELKNFGMTKNKAKAIFEVSKLKINHQLPSLKEISRDPNYWVDELQKVYGIGIWTAELSVAMVSKFYDVGPVDDLNVMKSLMELGVSKENSRDFVERFGEYKGLVMYHLAFRD